MRRFAILSLVLTAFACACEPTTNASDAGNDGAFGDCIPEIDAGPLFKETLELQSADGETKVRILRRPGDGPVVGETFAFELFGFALLSPEMGACVADRDSMRYTYGHHNWDERAEIDIDEVTYVLTMQWDFEPGWNDRLARIRKSDQSPLGEATILQTASCVSEGPSPLNGCFRRRE